MYEQEETRVSLKNSLDFSDFLSPKNCKRDEEETMESLPTELFRSIGGIFNAFVDCEYCRSGRFILFR